MVRQRPPGQPDRVGGGAQVAADEGEVGGLDRDVGAGAHREAEVGLGERGGVVDAVADHRDDPALGLQPRTTATLSAGSTSAITCVDADLARRPLAATRGVVAGEQDRAQPERRAARPTASALVGLTVSATTSTPRTAPSQPTSTAVRPAASAAPAAPTYARPAGPARSRASSRAGPTTTGRDPSTTPATPRPAGVRERRARRGRAARARAARGGDAPRAIGCSERPPARRRAAAARRRSRRRRRTTSTSVIRPVVTVPVLSSTTCRPRGSTPAPPGP